MGSNTEGVLCVMNIQQEDEQCRVPETLLRLNELVPSRVSQLHHNNNTDVTLTHDSRDNWYSKPYFHWVGTTAQYILG